MSRREKKELARLKTLIDCDRKSANANFDELFKQDVRELLKDYFDIEGEVNFSLEAVGDRYKIDVGATALRIKNFSSLPK